MTPELLHVLHEVAYPIGGCVGITTLVVAIGALIAMTFPEATVKQLDSCFRLTVASAFASVAAAIVSMAGDAVSDFCVICERLQ